MYYLSLSIYIYIYTYMFATMCVAASLFFQFTVLCFYYFISFTICVSTSLSTYGNYCVSTILFHHGLYYLCDSFTIL